MSPKGKTFTAKERLADARATLADAKAALDAELSRLRQEIAGTKQELDRLALAPAPRAKVESDVQAALVALAREPLPLVRVLRQVSGAGAELHAALLNAPAPAIQAQLHGADELRAAIMARLDRLAEAHGDWPVPDDAHERRRAELRQKLADLEQQEETLLRDAEQLGLRLARRPDASPAAVLGLSN